MIQIKLLAFITAAATLVAPTAASADQPHPFAGDRQVTVMTRNLYLGTDLAPIFSAPDTLALLAAAGSRWAQVQANDFPARAESIADEIAAAKPDVVGLQEAMLYRTDFPPDGPSSAAETTAIEFVELLEEALVRRGLDYDVVSTVTGSDVEIPAGLPPALDVRMTDRVVILARGDESTADLKLSNAQSGSYATAFTVQTAAGAIRATRGWASVDVKARGKSFRFVTTHLEAFSSLVRNPQAAELLAGPTATDLPVVLVGDMNSGPGFDTDAYSMLLDGGFTDAWLGGDGFTCCHAVDLSDPNPTLTKRIDLVLTKGGFETVSVSVVGEEAGDRTVSGLWPSDHAGVVATLRLPAGSDDRS